jgi:hypothetical protein
VIAAGVRDGAEDLAGLEVAQVDAGDAVVGVVVDEEPASVVKAAGLRERGMVEMWRIEGRPATKTWPECPPE